MATVAAVRARAKGLAREHIESPIALIDEATRLAHAGDDRLAFELFRAAPRAVAAMTPAAIDRLLPTLHDWNSTDCFACFVSGVAWREGVLDDDHVAAWARSDNRWVRRAALVSTIPLNTKARGATSPRGEPAKTLALCTPFIDDRDDMVVKALSWALRELAARDRASVEKFVRRHRDRLAPRVIREVTNILTTGLKNPVKSSKPKAAAARQAARHSTRKP